MRRLLLISVFSVVWLTFQAQSYVQIGSGTASTSYPVYGVWNYGWYSAVFTQSEVGDTKQITSLSFECINGPKSLSNQKIYLKHSTVEVFGDASYENPLSNGYTLVYDGPVTYDGWTEITFTTPFDYNGTDNLIVHYESHHGSSTYANFNSTTSAVNNNKGAGNDQAFPTTAGYLNPYPSSRPNVRLFYTPAGQEPCTPAIISPVGGEIKVSISPALIFDLSCNTTSYDLLFGPSSGAMQTVVSNATVSEQGTYTWSPTDLLDPSTAYRWKVIAKNGDLTAESPVMEFTTEGVINNFPYNNGFEDNEVWTPGWYGDLTLTDWHYATSPINWGLASPLNVHSGQSAAKIDMFQVGSWALTTPRIILGENKVVSFWWKNNVTITDDGKIANYDTTFFQVSQDGGISWLNIDSFAPEIPNDWTIAIYDLSAYAGNNVKLRWLHQVNSTGGNESFFFDDLNISTNNNTPEIMISESAYAFGNLCQDGITSHKVVITNQGTGVLNITGVEVLSPFSSTYTGTIAPGATDTATIVFNATDLASSTFTKTATFNINGDFTGTNTMTLSGNIIAPVQSIYQTFESTATGSMPDGWSKFRSSIPTELYNDVQVKEVTSFEYISATHSLKFTNANDSVSILAAVLPGVANFGTHELKFYAAKNNMETEDVGLIIGLTSDPYNSESIEEVQTILLTDVMTQYTVTFPAENTKPYITIAHNNIRKWKSIYLDELSWQDPSVVSVPNPAQIVYPDASASNVDIMNGVKLQWTNGGGAPVGYRISVGTDNPPSNILNAIDLSDQTECNISKENVDFSSTLYWQVIPYNAEGDAVDCPVWSFSTMSNPSVSVFPWLESFETITNTSDFDVPLGWSIENNGDEFVSWDLIANSQNAPDNAYDGNQAMHMAFSFLNPIDDWMFTPPMQLEGGSTYKFSFWTKVKLYNGESYEALQVKWGTDNSSDAMYEIPLYYNDNMTSDIWQLVESEITPTEDGLYYFGFQSFSQPLQFLTFIDLVSLVKMNDEIQYAVTFTITDSGYPVEGVSVTINNEVLTSNSAGIVEFQLPNGQYGYTIMATKYNEVSGNFVVDGDNVDIPIGLTVGILYSEIEKFNLFPNPVVDVVSIQAESNIEEVVLFDIKGKVIYAQIPNKKDITINVADLSTGVYFIQITSNQKISSARLIKQ